MVWPRVSRIGWSNEHVVRKFGAFMEYQKVGDPTKLMSILKRVGSHVSVFEFNYVKDTQQVLELPQEQRGEGITEYEYSLPIMFSMLNPSCVVELVLQGTPIQSKELILIANTFTQLRSVNFSCGSLSCTAEEKPSITESFAIFLEKLSSYGKLEELWIISTYDSTHLHFEHIPASLKSLRLLDSKLNSRDLRHIGLRCHQLEELTISVHHEVTRDDLDTLFGGMQNERLRNVKMQATFDSPNFEMPFVEFSSALRNGVQAIGGDRTTAPVVSYKNCEACFHREACLDILRNIELFDFPLLLFVGIRSDIITDEAIKVLAKFPGLWNLELDCDEITDQAVIPIIRHGSLKVLSVSSRFITDKVPRLAIERCKVCIVAIQSYRIAIPLG
ncbi:hypothetical protein Ddc_07018 [Ditylenchus destructor]|nr:hypothetical protein Ddc_07018 [Ditylenchus destructor]